MMHPSFLRAVLLLALLLCVLKPQGWHGADAERPEATTAAATRAAAPAVHDRVVAPPSGAVAARADLDESTGPHDHPCAAVSTVKDSPAPPALTRECPESDDTAGEPVVPAARAVVASRGRSLLLRCCVSRT
jgi:hypothetical protein